MRLSSIAERSSGIDARVAAIFRDMRIGLGATTGELARGLGTTPRVIDVLESGRLQAYPVWPETVRIVMQLGRLHQIDVRPILARIRDQVGPAGLGRVPLGPSRPKPAVRTGGWRRLLAQGRRRPWSAGFVQEDEARHRMRRRARRAATATFTLSAPIVVMVGLLWVAQMQPSLILGVASSFPERIARFVRPGAEYLIVHMAPRREGLRWIELDDPRLRKADKLRQASR